MISIRKNLINYFKRKLIYKLCTAAKFDPTSALKILVYTISAQVARLTTLPNVFNDSNLFTMGGATNGLTLRTTYLSSSTLKIQSLAGRNWVNRRYHE